MIDHKLALHEGSLKLSWKEQGEKAIKMVSVKIIQRPTDRRNLVVTINLYITIKIRKCFKNVKTGLNLQRYMNWALANSFAAKVWNDFVSPGLWL